MDGTGILFAFIFGAGLAHSLWRGEAGYGGVSARRNERPYTFWSFIVAYAGFVVVSLAAAFHPAGN